MFSVGCTEERQNLNFVGSSNGWEAEMYLIDKGARHEAKLILTNTSPDFKYSGEIKAGFKMGNVSASESGSLNSNKRIEIIDSRSSKYPVDKESKITVTIAYGDKTEIFYLSSQEK